MARAPSWRWSAPAAGAAEISVPQGVQATLTVRILEYDRALRGWSGGQLVVGWWRSAPRFAEDLSQALGGRDVQGVPIRVAEHGWRDAEGLRAWIERAACACCTSPRTSAADTAAALSVASGQEAAQHRG